MSTDKTAGNPAPKLPTAVPFNLDLFRAGRLALTRDGQKARYLGEIEYSAAPLVAHLEGLHSPFSFRLNGTWDPEEPSDNDLVAMAPEEITLYVNVYKPGRHGRYTTSRSFLTENAAKTSRGGEFHPQYLRTVPVKFEV